MTDLTDEQWYWDLSKGMAVPAPERGKADNLLGPYGSREEAEHWKDKVEARNESWKEADEAWNGDDEDDDPEEE